MEGKNPHLYIQAHYQQYTLLAAGKDATKQHEIFNSYYKFMVYRNPAERLFSAFRNKIELYPMVGLEKEPPHFNWFRQEIYEHNYPARFKKWKEGGGKERIHITFTEFIHYWLTQDDLVINAHFATLFRLSQPCLVQYNFYGKFTTFEQDTQVLFNRVDTNMNILDAGYYEKKGKPTSELVTDYYKSLTREQKEAVIKKLAVDLLFYYTIFPEERDSHKVIMDTDIDVPDLDEIVISRYQF